MVFATLFLSSCDRDPASPSATGSISAYVAAIDSVAQNIDPSGFEVTATGLGTTHTDSAGLWSFQSVPAGVYDISITKPGYGTYKYISQQFVGNADLYLQGVTLQTLPTFIPTIDSLAVNDSFPRRLEIYVSLPKRPDKLHGPFYSVLIDVDTSLAGLDGEHHYYETWSKPNVPPFDGVETNVYFDGVQAPDFIPSQQKLYVRATAMYGPQGDGTSFYYDPRLNQYFHTSSGPVSTVAQITLP